MARCKHDKGNIQQFTEICLDCGHNIYETEAEYEASLHKDISYLKRTLTEKNRLLKEINGEDDGNDYW
jgi:hypothetical protein